ncbi:hypothetical protein PFISCL1PPCAC_7554 [Pristionchus fissidentatus]|uniref:Uncharacterized protein n=1 Tax=Pristionchus fissidentatus TaxID=1538716 RepID=A0AAV5VDN2_9BILA|nr:hypothetical protein PFISCL1PPCAC_7554 [Pristionchus fissidentatus]
MSSSNSRNAREQSRVRKISASSNTDVRPESPLSDRSPRKRDSRKWNGPLLLPQTPCALPDSKTAPKSFRRYNTDQSQHPQQPHLDIEETHRVGDRVVAVDLEDIEHDTRGGTPPSQLSFPANASMLTDEEDLSTAAAGPKTSTPRKTSRPRRAQEPLLKQVLKKSTSRTRAAAPADLSVSSIDDSQLYHSAKDSFNSTVSRISTVLVEEEPSYRSANSTQRQLFSQQGAAPLERHPRAGRSVSRRSPTAVAPSCKLVTPLVVHTAQEVNAVSVTGQILVISQTLVRSAYASNDVRRLINKLVEYTPIISNEVHQVDIDHDNEHSKHEVFVGADAILIQRITTIHRGRDRNTFETEDRRTYKFVCEGDLLPEDRSSKQTKPRHLTIVAEGATVKNCEEIEKSERVMLIFDAADQPSRLVVPMPAETSLTHAGQDIVSKPSSFKDSPVAFDEHVRVSDHSHINVVRKAVVHSSPQLWDEPLTELKEQRVYTQQLAADAECEPVRITRSHSLSRNAPRARSPSASRRQPQPEQPQLSRSRSHGRHQNGGPVKRPHLQLSPTPSAKRRDERRRSFDGPRAEITPSAPLPTDVLTAISPIRDEPARRETRLLNCTPEQQDDTGRDSVSLPVRRSSISPVPQSLHHQDTLRFSPSSSGSRPSQQQPLLQRQSPVVRTARPPLRTPRRDASPVSSEEEPKPMIVDEDTSAGSSQSPTQNRTPTTVSPRRSRLATRVYQSPTDRRTQSRDPSTEADWERMLNVTQPVSPAADIARRIPDDLIPARTPAASDSRLARAIRARPSSSQRRSTDKARYAPAVRPLGAAKSCGHPSPLRRSISDHSIFGDVTPVRSLLQQRAALAAPANSAVALSAPFRRQQYAAAPAAAAPAAVAPVAPVPRPRASIKRQAVSPSCTTARPHTPVPQPKKRRADSPRPAGPVGVAQLGARADKAAPAPAPRPGAVRHIEFAMPANDKQIVGSGPSSGEENVELVGNPQDYDKGEILMKKLTLEAKINGHMWNLAVSFALKADRADMISFKPMRIRIDDQTYWTASETWPNGQSQTSVTPITGERTAARGSTSYDQLAPVPVPFTPAPLPALDASNASTTPSPLNQTAIRVAPKATAASSSKSKKNSEKKSKKSKSSEKKNRKTNDQPPSL